MWLKRLQEPRMTVPRPRVGRSGAAAAGRLLLCQDSADRNVDDMETQRGSQREAPFRCPGQLDGPEHPTPAHPS